MVINTQSSRKRNYNKWLDKFLHNKYIFLIAIANREVMGLHNTSYDLSFEFNITIQYARTILRRLTFEELLKKGKKIQTNESCYNNYLLTRRAKQGLRALAEIVPKFYKNEKMKKLDKD